MTSEKKKMKASKWTRLCKQFGMSVFYIKLVK